MSFGGSGDSSSSIAGSTDVTLSSPANDDFLGYDDITSKWQNKTLTGRASLANSGGVESVSFLGTITGSATLDLSVANVFSFTVSGTLNLSFTGATTPAACSMTVYVYGGGNAANVVNWPSTVRWPDGIVPTLEGASGSNDILVFETLNGGGAWYGNLVGNNYK